MVIGLKNSIKFIGISVISFCAIFIYTLFMNYSIDLSSSEAQMVDEMSKVMFDAQLMTTQWDNNMKLSNTPWYVNAKIYKGFINNTFSVTLEAKDLFNSSQNDAIMYNDAVHIVQKNFSPGRSVMLTLQYRFNTTRDRYRGTGAGNSEKSRF